MHRVVLELKKPQM